MRQGKHHQLDQMLPSRYKEVGSVGLMAYLGGTNCETYLASQGVKKAKPRMAGDLADETFLAIN